MSSHSFAKNSIYNARQMFDLAADVSNYHEFVPLCKAVKILDESTEANGVRKFKAELLIAARRFKVREKFLSEVTADPNALTVLSISNTGPVKHLENIWYFEDNGANGSIARMDLEYEMSGFALRMLMAASFDLVMNKVANAMEQRAHELYGNKR